MRVAIGVEKLLGWVKWEVGVAFGGHSGKWEISKRVRDIRGSDSLFWALIMEDSNKYLDFRGQKTWLFKGGDILEH